MQEDGKSLSWDELQALGNQIAELSAHLEAAHYRLLLLITEFDRGAGWNNGGCRSCAHWLSWRVGLALGAAREKVRVARAIEGLPRIGEAMRTGQLSYSKVRALTRIANPENEEKLLKVALSSTAAHVEKIVRAWRHADRAREKERTERQNRKRRLRPSGTRTACWRSEAV